MNVRQAIARVAAQTRSRGWRWGIVRRSLHGFFRRADAILLQPGGLATKNIYRILVLRPNHRLGNVLMLTPLIGEIERLFPGAEVDVLVAGDVGRDVFSNFVSVRRVHALPHYALRHPIRAIKTIAGLRRFRYDLIIDPCTDSNSNRLLICLLKTRHALGTPSRASASRVPWSALISAAPTHMATLPVFLLRHALIPSQAVNDLGYPSLDLRLTKAEQAAGRHVLRALVGDRNKAPGRTTIGIFANATGAKRYDPAWWLQFIDALAAAREEYTIIEIVAADACSRLNASFPAYYSTDARKLAALISSLDCFISADCGVMHLAAASGAPTIGLFSVTDAAKYAPYGGRNHHVETTGKDAVEVAASALALIENQMSPTTGPVRRKSRSALRHTSERIRVAP